VKKLLVFLTILGLASAGGVYWYNRSHTVQLNQNSFTYASVENGTMTESVSATGTLRPRDVIPVGCELSGKVIEVYADVNDIVRPGDKLLKIDDEMARLKLKQAEEAVRAAEANIEAAKGSQEAAQRGLNVQLELAKKGRGFRTEENIYRARVDAARAAVRAAQVKKQEAQTEVDRACLALDKVIVRVPEPGKTVKAGSSAAGKESPPSKTRYIVLDKKVVVGQMIAPPASGHVFTLATDLRDMQVNAQVAEGDIARIKKGLETSFTVSAYSESDSHFRGKVSQRKLTPNTIQGAVYYDVVIDVVNSIDPATKEWRLDPGMTASVDIILREHHHVWKVPTAALNFELDEHYQTARAKEKLARWAKRSDRTDWKALWVWDEQRRSPWPIFVRINRPGSEAAGIKDSQFNEILEWEPGREPKNSRDVLKVIIEAPPVRKPGLFDSNSNLKLS
jgi:HlyD family secretion protein